VITAAARALDIVQLQTLHLRDVQRIDQQVYTRPWSLAVFRQELAMPESRVYLVARRHDGAGEIVAGHAGMMLVAGEAHITTVAVDPAWQGQGVASRLLLALHHTAIARGVTAMTLEVRVGNDRAIELYRRFGYAPAGVRKNYYSDEGEDGLIMWAHDVHLRAHGERLAAIDRRLAAAPAPSDS
jgi:ribosomal-protein-alanine N-acetyltransferase